MAQAAASSDRFSRLSQLVPSVVNCSRMTGDDADRTQNDQATGGAEKAADHGIGYITDRAAHPRQAEAAEHQAGQ